MQNLRVLPSHHNWARAAIAVACCFACLVVVALLSLAAVPQQAWAKSYTMPKVAITAQAETDGSLHVVERRTFDFDGTFSAVWWTFQDLPSNAKVSVNSVRTAATVTEGATAEEFSLLPSVPFMVAWRDEGGPSTPAYSYDSPQNTLYAFFPASDTSMTVEIDYTVENGVQAYEDVADVYWKYLGDAWDVGSDDVSMTLTLPVPQGVEVTPGQNVRAWGHGPLDGTLSVNADGSVTYQVPHVNAGQYAEAHVVFPVGWLANLSAESKLLHQSEMRLDTVLQDEKAWVDQANAQRSIAFGVSVAALALCVVMLLVALLVFLRFGKEHKPDFTERYWRDVPDRQTHPALIGRLWRWNHQTEDDVVATLMHLSSIGAIRINRGSYKRQGAFGKQHDVQDYYLTKVPEVADSLTFPLDRSLLDLLFKDIATNGESLWLDTIEAYGKSHPQAFVTAMELWQGELTKLTEQREFFEKSSKRAQHALIGMVVALVVIAFGELLFFDNLLLPAVSLVTAIAVGVIANYVPRRSVAGNNLVARCKALRNWLRDFSQLDERPVQDVSVWGQFMVYAYQFGIARQVMRELRLTMPNLMSDQAALNSSTVPWWIWYDSRTVGGTQMPSLGDAFAQSVSSTLGSAQAALSAASGDYGSSSGAGGGFSGGGGGGFSSGGGAR